MENDYQTHLYLQPFDDIVVLDALLNDDGSANILDNKNRCEKHGDDFRHNETVYDVCKNNFTDESSDEFK
jgi:hypothetical protein